jgi:calmodulin
MKKNNAGRRDSFEGIDISQDDKDSITKQFGLLDRQKQGTIFTSELKYLFEAMNEYHPKETFAKLQSWVEETSGAKKIDLIMVFRAFCRLKQMSLSNEEEEFDVDILNTFVAMGGNSDKSGFIKKQKLVEIIKVQFGLTIDMEQMFDEAGIETDGDLEFNDFVMLMEPGGSQRSSRICSIFSTT